MDDIDRDVSAKREHFVCSVIPEPNGEIVVAGTSVARSDTEERWHWFLMWFDARGQHLRTARRSQQLGGAGAPDYMTSRMHSAIRTRAGGYVCVGEATRASPLFARHAVEYFTADGSLDEEFGTLGIVFELPQGTEAGYAAHDVIEIDGPQEPGRFLVVGEAPDPDLGRVMTITRFRADLVRDVSFGSRGTLMYPFRGKASGARRIAALSRDALVVGGWYGVSEQFIELDFALLRLDGDGRPDLSMGIDAELSVDVTPLDHLTDMLAQRGRVLIGGYTGGPARGVLARFDSRGADPTFPNTPIPMPIAPGGGPRYVSTQVAALTQTSHSLYAVGRADTGAQTYALVCRFTEEGVLDPQPGAEGLKVDSLHATDRWQARFDAVTVQRGMLICAGTSDGNVALARYWP